MLSKAKIIQKLAIIHKGKVLALQRSLTDKTRPGAWDFPGGNIDDEDVTEENGDIVITALRREIKEEIGLELSDTKIKAVYVDSGYHPDGFLVIWIGYTCELKELPEVKLSHEHSGYKWLTKEEFLKLDFGYAKDSMEGQIRSIELK